MIKSWMFFVATAVLAASQAAAQVREGPRAWGVFASHCIAPITEVQLPLTDGLERRTTPDWMIADVAEVYSDPRGWFAITIKGDPKGDPLICEMQIHPEVAAPSYLASLDWRDMVLADQSYIVLEEGWLFSETATGVESFEWREPRMWVTTDFGAGGVLILTVEETHIEG